MNSGRFPTMQLCGNGAAVRPCRFLAVALFSFLICVALSWHRAQTIPQVASPVRGQPGQFLEIDGTKIYYEECGSGPAIVLLHDGLLGSSTWDDVWPLLCAEFHVIRYDRRGYGRSDSPKSPFSPTGDLRAVLQHANSKPAVIVGNSSGGALAIDFALEHPEMVEGLFLIGPVVHASPKDLWRAPMANAPDQEIRSTYSELRTAMVIYGHIHVSYVRPLSGMTVANAGSISQSYDGDRRAAYAVIDGESVTIRRVEYDVESEATELLHSDLPHAEWLSRILLAGKYCPPE